MRVNSLPKSVAPMPIFITRCPTFGIKIQRSDALGTGRLDADGSHDILTNFCNTSLPLRRRHIRVIGCELYTVVLVFTVLLEAFGAWWTSSHERQGLSDPKLTIVVTLKSHAVRVRGADFL